ncbi:unnamed protein product [Calypogeia fissa]
MKLYKVPRKGMYRWSEDARLQVIHGVKMMENKLSQAGQIKSWREIAASLPKNLFWDIDLNRLANIAKKQFSEMKRRYRIIMDHKNSGRALRPIRFKTLTKKVLREMATYEEGCLQRTPRASRRAVRKLCNGREKIPWVTKTPSQALNAQGAHGAVLVEILSRSGMGIKYESFDGVFAELDPVYGAHGRDENRIVPNDGDFSCDDEPKESADAQAIFAESSSEGNVNSASSYNSELLRSEGRYAKEWEAQDLSNRERIEAPFAARIGTST